MEPRTESSGKSSTAAIAGGIGGVVTLLVVIIIITCVSKRRKRKPLKLAKGFEGVTFTAVSMRDRIRAESMRALDESKVLSLFNPDDIKQLPLTSIEYVRDLGSGNFGLVFLGMYIKKNLCLDRDTKGAKKPRNNGRVMVKRRFCSEIIASRSICTSVASSNQSSIILPQSQKTEHFSYL